MGTNTTTNINNNSSDHHRLTPPPAPALPPFHSSLIFCWLRSLSLIICKSFRVLCWLQVLDVNILSLVWAHTTDIKMLKCSLMCVHCVVCGWGLLFFFHFGSLPDSDSTFSLHFVLLHQSANMGNQIFQFFPGFISHFFLCAAGSRYFYAACHSSIFISTVNYVYEQIHFHADYNRSSIKPNRDSY